MWILMMTAFSLSSPAAVSALTMFVLVSSITPGPNNLMLLAGGMRCGFRACRAHMLGITFGCAVMICLAYWGMAALFRQPYVEVLLRALGCAYLLYLTYALAKNGVVADETLAGKMPQRIRLPLHFWQAVLFQWVNPKAWVMVLLMPAIATLDGHPLTANLPLVALAAVINLACISVWAYGGHGLQKLWHYPRLMKMVYQWLVLMTLYCAVAMWL